VAAPAGLATGTGTALNAGATAVIPPPVSKRIHGRSGVAYLSLNYGDAASPAAFLSGWSVSWSQNPQDVTGIPDGQHIYIAGIPASAGSFDGYFDTATAQAYSAAVDGLPRNMYLYPSAASAGTYFSGMVLPDYSTGGGVSAAVALKVTWASAAPVTRTG
jgi:hypothetical protein